MRAAPNFPGADARTTVGTRMSSERKFPADFTFGVATAAYQVEGHIENDWSDWERAGKCKDPNVRCGRGVDHWNRFDEDVQLTRDVGATAFRVSIEWARVEPERGQVDEAVLAEYRARLQRMQAAGVRPVVTLHHFTHPKWFHVHTPWHEAGSVAEFRRYARLCAEHVLRGLDAVVLTFNEPMVLLLGGYLQGVIPPGIADGGKAVAALANIGRAHAAAREEVLTHAGKLPLGISQNQLAFAPDRMWHPLDRALVRLGSEAYNHAFLRALCDGELRLFMPGIANARIPLEGARDSMDFVGINYYSRAHLRFVTKAPFLEFRFKDPRKRGLTDIGWEDYPDGFGQMLKEARAYGLPVWVTENGVDDRSGKRRSRYLYEHWQQLLDAMAGGTDVRGYLHWSLLDNFEWLEGWGPRFGLYQVDFETMERKRTPACDYFHKVATTGTLVAPPNGGDGK
jgi:beta-glucosidase